MQPLTLRGLDGSNVKLEASTVTAALKGEVLTPDSAAYQESRSLWNGMIDRRPGLIVRPSTESEVASAVNFARERRIALAVKGGGHNIAGKALVDGGLVIDFSRMQRVDVDAKTRRARVQPGATLGAVDRATQPHGLAVPVGVNSTTGIAGLTLGGGFGWTTRKLGLTVDNLVSARLVTASGTMLAVDRDNHADLYWAIRGGGGNFGVVTEFELALHPVGPQVLAGMVVHPFADLHNVVTRYQNVLRTLPDELTAWLVLRKAPPLPFLPVEWHGREIIVLAMCWIGALADGESATAELRSIGRPIADVVGPMAFVDWQAAFDPLLTPGARNYWKSHDVERFDDASIAVLEDAIANLPTEECEVFLAHLGGALTRVAAGATPWPNRKPHFIVNVHTRWRDARDDNRCRDWARRLHERLAPHSMGSLYVNFIPEGDEDRVTDAYGANYERLAAIKRRFDPDNLFRANLNIAPRS